MFARWRGQKRAWALLGVGLYALVLVVSPLLHHDLDCHLKSPAHCGACVANPLGSRVERGIGLEAQRLPVAEWVEALRQPALPTASPGRPSGRSPPA